MPRRAPFATVDEMLAWITRGFKPCSANSREQNALAKNPRSSSLRSRSTRKTPLTLVSSKRILFDYGESGGRRQYIERYIVTGFADIYSEISAVGTSGGG